MTNGLALAGPPPGNAASRRHCGRKYLDREHTCTGDFPVSELSSGSKMVRKVPAARTARVPGALGTISSPGYATPPFESSTPKKSLPWPPKIRGASPKNYLAFF